jgi:maltooligosyltrehalose trehalohydrolase
MGLDSMWCDDFHHAVHVLLTGETNGYYADFGGTAHLARAWETGMSYQGELSDFRQRSHGREIPEYSARYVVACVQNHDQIGNRMLGERLSVLVDFEKEKLAAAVLLLSPHVPLLFMGQEYGEIAPFQYFVSHGDPDLVNAVRAGRKEEFRAFGWKGEIPDPQSETTFERCKLDRSRAERGRHAVLRRLHEELLRLRHLLRSKDRDEAVASDDETTLSVFRGDDVVMLFAFGGGPALVSIRLPSGRWNKIFDSADSTWNGPGAMVPATVASSGPGMELSLPSNSCCVLQRVVDG